eukprot:1779623-Rhodomonas_salina.1
MCPKSTVIGGNAFYQPARPPMETPGLALVALTELTIGMSEDTISVALPDRIPPVTTILI